MQAARAALINVSPTLPGSGHRWTEADLYTGFIAPPTGVGYVRYQDLYVAGDTLQQVANKVTGNKILTLPEGEFYWDDFAQVNTTGLRIGVAGATGCRGISGSGRGTILKMTPNSSTHQSEGNVVTGTNQLNLLCIQGITGAVLENFSLIGTEQGSYYNGISVYACPNATLSGLYLRGASPGFANAPPGETFGINIYLSNDVTIQDTEIDGRDATTGARTGASPFGWNSASNANVYRTYVHSGFAGMPTFWQTQNVYTEDLISYSTGSGSGSLSGSALNHERAWGVIRHIRPTLKPNGIYAKTAPGGTSVAGSTQNNGLHTGLNNDQHDMNDVQYIEPIFDTGPGAAGCFSVSIGKDYIDGQMVASFPTIIKDGITLQGYYTDSSRGPTLPVSGTLDAALHFRVF
jgi:hypothetical protein